MDLSPEHFAAKVSRQQGRLYLRPDGTFRLTNTGRRKFLVNNCQVRPVSRPVRRHSGAPAALERRAAEVQFCKYPRHQGRRMMTSNLCAAACMSLALAVHCLKVNVGLSSRARTAARVLKVQSCTGGLLCKCDTTAQSRRDGLLPPRRMRLLLNGLCGCFTH